MYQVFKGSGKCLTTFGNTLTATSKTNDSVYNNWLKWYEMNVRSLRPLIISFPPPLFVQIPTLNTQQFTILMLFWHFAEHRQFDTSHVIEVDLDVIGGNFGVFNHLMAKLTVGREITRKSDMSMNLWHPVSHLSTDLKSPAPQTASVCEWEASFMDLPIRFFVWKSKRWWNQEG